MALENRDLFPRFLAKVSLADRVYFVLVSEFFQFDRNQVFPLTEGAIAQMLGVSRHAVRNALSLLAREDYIEQKPGVGIILLNPDGLRIPPEDVWHYFEIRKPIERYTVRRAAERRTKELEDSLHQCLSAQREAQQELLTSCPDVASRLSSPAWRKLVGLDVKFHSLLAEASGDPFIPEVLEMILARILPCRKVSISTPGRIEDTIKEHEKIFAAVMDGDPNAAAKAMEEHINAVRDLRGKPDDGGAVK